MVITRILAMILTIHQRDRSISPVTQRLLSPWVSVPEPWVSVPGLLVCRGSALSHAEGAECSAEGAEGLRAAGSDADRPQIAAPEAPGTLPSLPPLSSSLPAGSTFQSQEHFRRTACVLGRASQWVSG